jgi:probable selenium-dependent hydroxylase accessory protein YqeC
LIQEALRVQRGDVVAVAGAGGKTTLCYRLAGEARAAGLTVLVTTTTHMGSLPRATTGPVVVEAEGPATEALRRALAEEGRATLLGRRVRDDKLEGVAPERVDQLAALADLVVVEADGARQRSLKTPAPHEPVIPASATLLLVLAALDVLGQPLGEERVHRLERVLAVSGIGVGDRVSCGEVAAVLKDPAGYPARIRPGLRAGVFLNKVEAAGDWRDAEAIAARLLPPYHFVAAGSARSGVARLLVS